MQTVTPPPMQCTDDLGCVRTTLDVRCAEMLEGELHAGGNSLPSPLLVGPPLLQVVPSVWPYGPFRGYSWPGWGTPCAFSLQARILSLNPRTPSHEVQGNWLSGPHNMTPNGYFQCLVDLKAEIKCAPLCTLPRHCLHLEPSENMLIRHLE